MFKLKRYFSITSLIGIVVISIVISIFFRQLALQSLKEHQTSANVQLTHSFANAVWKHFDSLVKTSMQQSADEVKKNPELEHLQLLTRQQMKSTHIVKVKIYNLNGLTVFSTDPKQIGADKSNNLGFLTAKAGNIASEIIFRNEFYALEEVISDRNLVATYLPITDRQGNIKGIFEVYSDVTHLVENMDAAKYKIMLVVLPSLAILYLFLFLIIKRADRILQRQEEERQQNEDRIRHIAYHDSLTGLPNRDSFNEQFPQAVTRAIRHDKNAALMFLDLDRFKLINDSLGHDAGDQLLRVTAMRVQKCMRDSDLVFRLGGDEFVIILDDMDDGEYASYAARRIVETMSEPVMLNDHEVIVNISIGITTFPKEDSNNDPDTLINEADSAMYRAKEAGHNNFQFYIEEMNTVAYERLSLETDLQLALHNDEFELYYQTKVHTGSSHITGMEALIRWNHPEKGLILPDKFITLLEEMGMIISVGNWVLMKACQQAKKWIDEGLPPLRMSVNISALQFRDPGFVNSVRNSLAASELDPRYLELELTETMFVGNMQHAIEVMHQLKSLGLSLSIDDFGSGYSSLSYLKNFPIDYIKIDQSFLQDLGDSKNEAIASAIISLAQNLSLGLIGEGVENESQRDFLKDKGCGELQGFLFSQPDTADNIQSLLQQMKA